VAEFTEVEAMNVAYESLMQQFKPRLRRRILNGLEILFLKSMSIVGLPSLLKFRGIDLNRNTRLQLARAMFIRNSWSTKQLTDVIDLIRQLENMENLGKLQDRFHFWHLSALSLNDKIYN
jgi:hypothetical protein